MIYLWDIRVVSFLFISLVILMIKTVITVPQGMNCVLERFGRYHTTLEPGITFRIPFVDVVRYWVSMKEACVEIPHQEVISRDNARVSIDGVAFIKVISAERASYAVEDYLHAIAVLSMNNLRTVLGSMDLDEILSHREAINVRLLSILNEAAATWGILVTRVEVRDVSPPQDLVEAMSTQMKAERQKRASILLAEGERQADILRGEGKKEAEMRLAEAERYRAFTEAEALLKRAEAQAEAIAKVSAAIQAGSQEALHYFVAEKYTQALSDIGTAQNSKLVLMPVEASGLVASVASIKELFSYTQK